MSSNKLLEQRLQIIRSHFWPEEGEPSKIDAIFLATSPKSAQNPDIPEYNTDDAFFHFSLNSFFPESFAVITKDTVSLFVSSKSAEELLSSLTIIKGMTLSSDSNTTQESLQKALALLESKSVGVTNDQISNSDLSSITNRVDIQSDIEQLLIPHEDSELSRIRNAAKIASRAIQNSFRPRLEDSIEHHSDDTCQQLSTIVFNDLNHTDIIHLKFNPADVRAAFLPSILTAETITLDFPTQSVPTPLKRTLSSCVVGVRYRGYVACVGRTFIINATESQKAAYNSIYSAEEAAIKLCKPGTPLNDVYSAYRDSLPSDLQPYCPSSIGFFTGIQLSTLNQTISASCSTPIPPKSALTLFVGLKDVPNGSEESDKFTILKVDTVQVEEEGGRLVSDDHCTFDDISYTFDEEGEQKYIEELLNDNTSMIDRVKQSHRLSRKEQHGMMDAEELKKLREREDAHDGISLNKEQDADDDHTLPVSFKQASELPAQIKAGEILVMQKPPTVFFPIFGSLFPVHIHMIKSAQETNQENDSELRVNFQTAITIPSGSGAILVKELMFQQTGQRKFNGACKRINDLIHEYQRIQKKRKLQLEVLSTSEKFEPVPNNEFPVPLRLSSIHLRQGSVASSGVLEAGRNGFRYRSSGNQAPVFLPYTNVKLAIYQRSNQEMITLLHFVLRKKMNLGGDKTTDQMTFFRQVTETYIDTSKDRMMSTEQAEIAEEEHDRKVRKKINDEFKKFCLNVQQLKEKHLTTCSPPEFEAPSKKLLFIGTSPTSKQQVKIMPTVSALIAVTEPPPFILMKNDVEVAILERLQFTSRSFDITFVFNDWKKDPIQVTTIDPNFKDRVEDVFRALKIQFYEYKTSIDWKEAMEHLRKVSKEEFQEEGGWKAFTEEEEDNNESSDFDENANEDEEEEEDDEEQYMADTDEDEEPYENDDDEEEIDERQQDEEAAAADRKMIRKFYQKDESHHHHEHHHHHH